MTLELHLLMVIPWCLSNTGLLMPVGVYSGGNWQGGCQCAQHKDKAKKYPAIVLVAGSLKNPCTAEICSFLMIPPHKGDKNTQYGQGTQDLGYQIKHDSSPIKNMTQFFSAIMLTKHTAE